MSDSGTGGGGGNPQTAEGSARLGGPWAQIDPPGFEPPGCDVVVIGCGNLLRGDDGVGPILVRQLAEAGVAAGVRLVDAGTAGMDAAFAMRGARRVVVVDASRTGAAPGTVFQVPGAELEDLPLDPLHPHAFRWDQALAFGRWLLGDGYPDDVVVYLVEAAGVEPGAALSAPVRRAMDQVRQLIIGSLPAPPTADDHPTTRPMTPDRRPPDRPADDRPADDRQPDDPIQGPTRHIHDPSMADSVETHVRE